MRAAGRAELPLQGGLNVDVTKLCTAICACVVIDMFVYTYMAHLLLSSEPHQVEGSVAPKVTNSIFMQTWVLSAPLWPQVALFSLDPSSLLLLIPDTSDPKCDCNMDYEAGGLSLFGFKIRKKILFPIRALHVFTL